jgi:hypothetical protein
MWHTSTGLRTLNGAEAALVKSVVGLVWDFVELEGECPDAEWSTGVTFFDALDWRQRVVQLAFVANALLRDDAAAPPLNAVNEATVGMLFRVIGICVETEIDAEEGEPNIDCRNWRRRLLKAALGDGRPSDMELPTESCTDLDEWNFLIEMLSDAILWDDDWIDDGLILDADPETAKARKEMLGIEDDYYQTIVPEPSDSDLHGARQMLRNLIAGTEG